MVPTDGEPDVDSLSAWRTALARQAEDLRAEIRVKQNDLARVEERLSLVTKLLEVETRVQVGAPNRNPDGEAEPALNADVPARTSTPDLEVAVEEILRVAAEPLHISKIREMLLARGVPLPGRGDEANIIVRLRRLQHRFTRTARGTYGLAEWGLPALASKARKRRRATAR